MIEKEITVTFTSNSSRTQYATVYTNSGETSITSNTSVTVKVTGIIGVEFPVGAGNWIRFNDISESIGYTGDIRYFAIKNTTESIQLEGDYLGGGSNA